MGEVLDILSLYKWTRRSFTRQNLTFVKRKFYFIKRNNNVLLIEK